MGTEQPVKGGPDGTEASVLLYVVGGVAEKEEGGTKCGAWVPTGQGLRR